MHLTKRDARWNRASNYDLVGTKGFEPLYGGTKIHRLTTWRCPKNQSWTRKTGFEPATPSATGSCSTTELLPQSPRKRLTGEGRDSNPQLSGPQPDTLPLSYIRPLSPRRIERRTLRLSSVRSNQLSYGLKNSDIDLC